MPESAQRLIVTTDAGHYGIDLPSADGLVVTDMSLHALVPGAPPWLVVAYQLDNDGGKELQLVACDATGKVPRCTEPLPIERGDLRDAPTIEVRYPETGGISLVPIRGTMPVRDYRVQ